jgi:hypothetical protein
LGLSVEGPKDEELLEMKPKLSSDVSLQKYSLPVDVATVNFHDGCEMAIPIDMAKLMELFDGKTTILQALNARISKTSQLQEPDELDEFLIELSAKESMPIIRRLLEKKVLIIE